MNPDLVEKACETLAAFQAKRLMIATVESCTGGLIAAALTEIPGSSNTVERGFVTYSNKAKTELVGVDPDLIMTHGAVSPEVAEAMARGGLACSAADIAVAVTGIAGPGGSDHKPEGLVCLHVAARTGAEAAAHVEFGAIGRANVRRETVLKALDMAIAVAARS